MNDLQTKPSNGLHTTLSPQDLHDLRNPLNQIIGYSDLLAEQAEEDGHSSYASDARKIQAAGHQMLSLLSNGSAPKIPEEVQSATPSVNDHMALGLGQALILVVDDVKMNRDVLAQRLERQNHIVVFAENGRAAIDILRTRPFDLILLDIMMPDMDGYEALRQIKADEALRHIPVIMISALDEIDSVARCIELGAEDYLVKPFNPTLLKARIGASLEKKGARDREVKLFEELQHSYARLQQLEKMRDDLTHMIVHDLRTPLGSLISGVQTLEYMGDLNASQVEMVAIAVSGGETLQEMINGLLDVNKLESGSMELNLTVLDSGQLVGNAIAQVAPLAQERSLNLVQDIETGLPSLEGDENVLIRVLVNLLGNAIKFTSDRGTVTVSVRKAEEPFITFSVKDTGEGIPADSFDQIFEKFGQVETRQRGRTMSTGLGLTFCKLAVEAHGGQIYVESSPGQGSTFSMKLPICPPNG